MVTLGFKGLSKVVALLHLCFQLHQHQGRPILCQSCQKKPTPGTVAGFSHHKPARVTLPLVLQLAKLEFQSFY